MLNTNGPVVSLLGLDRVLGTVRVPTERESQCPVPTAEPTSRKTPQPSGG